MTKTAFLFPGQGAQSIGMGQTLLAELPAARERFSQASEILGYDLAEVCGNGPADRLDSTAVSQPALYVTSLAALDLLARDEPAVVEHVSATAGLSLGEYTALAFAGVLDFETGLRLVKTRGEAMQRAADAKASGMVSLLGLEPEQVESLCSEQRQGDEVLQVANLLCPGNIVVSGDQAACDRIAAAAPEAGAMKAIPLAVAGAFPTPLMADAQATMTAALDSATLSPPRLPVLSNVDAAPHDDPDEIRALLVQQIVSPVRWHDTMQSLLDQGFDTFYEIGPGRVLRGLLRRIQRKATCHNVGS